MELNRVSGFFAFPGKFFGWIELINMAGVLHEAGDADSRACIIS